MGDMGDDFRAWDAEKKRRKEKRLNDFNPEGWTCVTEYHYYMMLNGKRLDYWPSTNRFRYEGKTHFGNVEGFIKNRRIEEVS